MNLTKELSLAIANHNKNSDQQKVYDAISKCLDLKDIDKLLVIDDKECEELHMINILDNSNVLNVPYDVDANIPEYVLNFFKGLEKTYAVKSYCTWFKINILSKEVSNA